MKIDELTPELIKILQDMTAHFASQRLGAGGVEKPQISVDGVFIERNSDGKFYSVTDAEHIFIKWQIEEETPLPHFRLFVDSAAIFALEHDKTYSVFLESGYTYLVGKGETERTWLTATTEWVDGAANKLLLEQQKKYSCFVDGKVIQNYLNNWMPRFGDTAANCILQIEVRENGVSRLIVNNLHYYNTSYESELFVSNPNFTFTISFWEKQFRSVVRLLSDNNWGLGLQIYPNIECGTVLIVADSSVQFLLTGFPPLPTFLNLNSIPVEKMIPIDK